MRTPQEIVSETINQIINELNQEEINSPLSSDSIDAILKKHISVAYEEGGEARKKEIYRALSVQLHPDKLNRQYPKLFTYLNMKNMTDAPFKLINELNTGNLFYKITADPMNGLGTSYAYLINKLTPLFSVYERYWQPFKFIVEILSWLILIPVLLGIGASTLIFFITQFVVDFLEKIDLKLLNFITRSQYSTELKEYVTPQFDDLKKEHLDFIRKEGKENLINNNEDTRKWDEMSDDDLYELLITNECIKEISRLGQHGDRIADHNAIRLAIEEQYKQQLLDDARIIGFSKLKIVFNAFYVSLARPLSEQSILSKLFQFILAPLSLISASIIEFIRFANTAVLFVITGASLLGLVIPIALLNTPLYIIDLFSYVSQQIGQYFHSSTAQDDSDFSYEVDGHNGGPKAMRLLALEDGYKEDSTQYNVHNANISALSLNGCGDVSKKDTSALIKEEQSVDAVPKPRNCFSSPP